MSLFGASAAPTFSFGQSSTSTATPAAPATSAPSLFGQTAASAPTTSLFGGGSSAGGGGGLFGSTPTTTSIAGTTPSLFGGLSATTSQTPAASKPAFSFGSTTTAPTSTPSLFGTTPAAAPNPSTGGGLFGSTPTAPGAGGGLFGQSLSAPSTTPSLFGQSTAQPSALGQSQAPTAATAATNALNKQTKFQDLPDQARNLVEEMDKFIRSQGQLADELKSKSLGSEVTQTKRMLDQFSAESTTVTSLLEQDSRLVAALRTDLERSLADLSKTTILIEAFKAGPSNSTKLSEAKAVSGFPLEYFQRKTIELEQRLHGYRQTVDQISSVFSSPQASLSPSSILPTLKAQHASMMSLASQVSTIDLELQRLKDDYRGIWREKTGRLVDPFRLGQTANGVRSVENGVRGIEIR
ncbi:FG-nucleoporin NUP49 [Sporobolomyces koalae]|uniref:FG-nucleoporin NUP49 n=1 Tax=Sporobolomyces koalae TaxID=500713 RepID=UPI00317A70B0